MQEEIENQEIEIIQESEGEQDEIVIADKHEVIPANIEYKSPGDLLALAIHKDFDIDRLTKLMDLQERWEKNEAKKAYIRAMTEFKKDPPKIYKDMLVEFPTKSGITRYNHASLGNCIVSLTEDLAKHGFSTKWDMSQQEKNVTITNIITHSQGHSETVSITSPADPSQYMNPMQAIASTQTYLERYTFLANIGLAPLEKDSDGRIQQKIEINNNPDWKPDGDVDRIKSIALSILDQLYVDKKLLKKDYNTWKNWIQKAIKSESIYEQIETKLKPKLEEREAVKRDEKEDSKKDKQPESESQEKQEFYEAWLNTNSKERYLKLEALKQKTEFDFESWKKSNFERLTSQKVKLPIQSFIELPAVFQVEILWILTQKRKLEKAQNENSPGKDKQ